MVNNKRRSVLKAVTPIPVVSGKSTVEVEATKSALSHPGRKARVLFPVGRAGTLAIIRMKPAKASRIVQTLKIVPVSKEIVEETDVVETFKQQLAEGLCKIWPTKSLEPGEYAVVEYTEGKGNIQVCGIFRSPRNRDALKNLFKIAASCFTISTKVSFTVGGNDATACSAGVHSCALSNVLYAHFLGAKITGDLEVNVHDATGAVVPNAANTVTTT